MPNVATKRYPFTQVCGLADVVSALKSSSSGTEVSQKLNSVVIYETGCFFLYYKNDREIYTW